MDGMNWGIRVLYFVAAFRFGSQIKSTVMKTNVFRGVRNEMSKWSFLKQIPIGGNREDTRLAFIE